MGRRKYVRRKFSKKRRGKQTLAKPHDSEPERCSIHHEEDQESLAWDSLDEISLPPTPSGAEYLPSPDEMEVTRRFSCLNFSMLPSPDLMLALEPPHIDPGLSSCQLDSVDVTMTGDVLPSLCDEDGLFGCKLNRQSRKRPSRRKPNKRTKKIRHSLNPHENSAPTKHHTVTSPQSLCVSFVRPTATDPQFSRARSFRRPRRPKPDDDPLLCFFSDTSVICDGDGFVTERMDDSCDFVPPTHQSVGGGEGCEGVGGMANESDLSETSSSDSGCEGDDEESSVEGPHPRRTILTPTGKVSVVSTSSDDEQFTQILQGAFPLMSEEGQKQFQGQLYPSLPEFKHPGRAGLGGRGARKKRCKPPQLSNPLTLMEVNQMIVKFVQSSSETELKFNFVSRALCRTISCLASVYKLDCFIEQKRRLPVASPLLRKSLLTRLASRQEIEPILRNHGRESPTMWLRESLTTPIAMDTMESRPLAVVAQGIPPLSESNIGNRMLRNMGWSPGTALGLHGNGIKDPVKAKLRPKNTGLGYS